VVIALIALIAESAALFLDAALYLRSDAGDYIGGGQCRNFSGTGVITLIPSGDSYLNVQVNGIDWWDLNLSPGSYSNPIAFAPGAYENATRYPFNTNNPGMDFGGAGRGCNTIKGRFDVLEVTFTKKGEILAIAANFEQHCEGNPSALWGQIRINSSIALDPPPTNTCLPVNCGYGSWSSWSSCQGSCVIGETTQGTRARSRAFTSYPINGGVPCNDTMRFENSSCIISACAVPATCDSFVFSPSSFFNSTS